MRRFPVLRTVPVACAIACGDATQPAPGFIPILTTPTFASAALIPSGAAADTACVIGTQGWLNYEAEPHFAANDSMGGLYLPYTVFTDAVEPPNQCGDLNFTNERTRWVKSFYATDAGKPDENPWKYWWRRSRRAETGTGALDSVARVNRSGDAFAWDSVPVPLSDEYDAIAVILVTTSDGGLVITDSAFLDWQYHASDKINLGVQHWGHRLPPDSVAATRNDRTVTLTWRNRHERRSIDSTNIYRNDDFLTTVGPSIEAYVDSNLATGIYAYSLKHVSTPALKTFHICNRPYPNSPSSDTVTVTVNDPPEAHFGVTCQQLPCTFADSSSDPDGTIVSWTWTFGDAAPPRPNTPATPIPRAATTRSGSS